VPVHKRGLMTQSLKDWHRIYLEAMRMQLRTQVQVDESRFKKQNTEALDRLYDLTMTELAKQAKTVEGTLA
jgi:hypothetical protein